MLKTILLLDGSEAMNQTNDYLPSYLLALRRPLCQFVQAFLDHSPLASLGVVVMRDGVSARLSPCTTSGSAIIEALERDYFLFGGSGCLSLENGLRHAMAELVDLKKVASAKKNPSARRDDAGVLTACHVLVISASVTHIDPHDVYKTIRTTAALGIHVSVISLVGAVHVLDVCASLTKGHMFSPLNYSHLQKILAELVAIGAAPLAALPQRSDSRKRAREAMTEMVQVGFPLLLSATRGPTTTQTGTVAAAAGEGGVEYLACPRCCLIQAAVPTTCALCRLLLCSVPLLLEAFVVHSNHALLPKRRRASGTCDGGSSSNSSAMVVSDTTAHHCNGCCASLSSPQAPARHHMYTCTACQGIYCWSCYSLTFSIGLCPRCVSLS